MFLIAFSTGKATASAIKSFIIPDDNEFAEKYFLFSLSVFGTAEITRGLNMAAPKNDAPTAKLAP